MILRSSLGPCERLSDHLNLNSIAMANGLETQGAQLLTNFTGCCKQLLKLKLMLQVKLLLPVRIIDWITMIDNNLMILQCQHFWNLSVLYLSQQFKICWWHVTAKQISTQQSEKLWFLENQTQLTTFFWFSPISNERCNSQDGHQPTACHAKFAIP